MRDRDNIPEIRPSEYTASSITPPRGLFSRIIKRLGLEKELAIVRGNLKLFGTLLVLFIGLLIFAFVALEQVLEGSDFGPFVSLVFSDPDAVVRYWHSFLLSVFESMPGIDIVFLLITLSFVLLFLRFAVTNYERFTSLIKSIRKN